MTQTASAFSRVSEALTFFVNYYTYLAGFKSVVDRLNSFDAAIEQAQALSNAGPAPGVVAGTSDVTLEDVDLRLPDGRLILATKNMTLRARRRRPTGPSGSASRLFRAIRWNLARWGWARPQSRGRPRDGGAAEPYIDQHIARRRHLSGVGRHPSDDQIRAALVDAHLGNSSTSSTVRTCGRSTCRAASSSALRSPCCAVSARLALPRQIDVRHGRKLEAGFMPYWRNGCNRRSYPSPTVRRCSNPSASHRNESKTGTSRWAMPRRLRPHRKGKVPGNDPCRARDVHGVLPRLLLHPLVERATLTTTRSCVPPPMTSFSSLASTSKRRRGVDADEARGRENPQPASPHGASVELDAEALMARRQQGSTASTRPPPSG
jgi:hypothetical protein